MLYVFHGPDSFSRNEALRELKIELDADGMLATNTIVFDARQASPAEVIAACDTAPFLGGRRLVIVEGAIQGSGGRRRRRKPSEEEADAPAGPWEALLRHVPEMPQSTTLVLVDGDATVGGLLDSLGGTAVVRRFNLPGRNEAAGWVQRRARALGIKLDGRAARRLAECVGSDTWLLAGELDKLAAYAGGEIIHEEDVRLLVTKVREEPGYLLADAVADGRPAQALRLLQELRGQGQVAGPLMKTIGTRYRRLAVAREMLDDGATARAIGERLGVSGYALERLAEQAASVSMAGICDALVRIAEADADIKRGVYEEGVSLELMVHDLAAAGASPRA